MVKKRSKYSQGGIWPPEEYIPDSDPVGYNKLTRNPATNKPISYTPFNLEYSSDFYGPDMTDAKMNQSPIAYGKLKSSGSSTKTEDRWKNSFANVKGHDVLQGFLATTDAFVNWQDNQRNVQNYYRTLRNTFTQKPIWDYNNLWGPNSNGGAEYQPLIMAKNGAEIRKSSSPIHGNVEIEGGEFLQLPDLQTEHIQGNSHKTGGVHTNLPSGAKVFSDHLKPKGSKKTYAQLAKKYDTLKYKEVLDNPFAKDPDRRTAEIMFGRNQNILNNLFQDQQLQNGDSDGTKFKSGGLYEEDPKPRKGKGYMPIYIQKYLNSGLSAEEFVQQYKDNELNQFFDRSSSIESSLTAGDLRGLKRKADVVLEYINANEEDPKIKKWISENSDLFKDPNRIQKALNTLYDKYEDKLAVCAKSGDCQKVSRIMYDIDEFNKESELVSGTINRALSDRGLSYEGYLKNPTNLNTFIDNPDILKKEALRYQKEGYLENPYFLSESRGIKRMVEFPEEQNQNKKIALQKRENTPTLKAREPLAIEGRGIQKNIPLDSHQNIVLDNFFVENNPSQILNTGDLMGRGLGINAVEYNSDFINPMKNFSLKTSNPSLANSQTPLYDILQDVPIEFDPYKSKGEPLDRTRIGKMDNSSKLTKEQINDLSSRIGYVGPKNNLSLQRWLMQNHPDIVNQLHTTYGQPNAGKPDDGLWGVRWDAALQAVADKVKSSQPPVANVPAPTLGNTVKNEPTVDTSGRTFDAIAGVTKPYSRIGKFPLYQAAPETLGFLSAISPYSYYTPDFTHNELVPATLNIQPQLNSINSSLQSGIRQNTGNASLMNARNTAMFNQALEAKQQAFANKQNYDAQNRFNADQFNAQARTKENYDDLSAAATVYNEYRAGALDNASTERLNAIASLTNKTAQFYQDEFRKKLFFDTQTPNYYYDGLNIDNPIVYTGEKPTFEAAPKTKASLSKPKKK